jgi:putative nucleotidyltransferase with HDIG domain
MRRRWSIRPSRVRREPRPPRSPAEHERRQRRYLVLVSLVLALALWGILAVRPPTMPGLQLGSPSPTDIRARRTMSFTSERLTEEQRVRAESAPDTAVYTRDPNIPSEQRGQLADLLQTITQIRDDPSLDAAAERNKLISLPNSTLVISPALAAAITRLSSDQWENVRRQALSLYDRALSKYDYALNDQAVTELRERSLLYWSSEIARDDQQKLMLLFASSFLKANSVLDEEATKKHKQAVRDAVQPVNVQILQGESIVRQGEIITPEIQEKLKALGELETETDWLGVGGKAILASLIAVIFGVYLGIAQREVWMVSRSLLVVAGLFALTLLAARVVMPLRPDWSYAFPLAMTAMLLAALFNNGLALVASTLLSLLIAFVGDNQFGLGVALLLSSMAGIFLIGRGERTLTFLIAGLVVALVMALTQAVFRLTTFGGSTFYQWVPIVIFSIMNGVLSAMLALGLYNLVGHMADVVTPLQLMELAHPAQPLLRKLIREAPGTYYHSVAVGNLAESAAEAIGADALLLRVAAYYHDIGKTIRPYFYTDNQSDRENVHNDLDPHTSAQIICEHVSEGVKMARAAGLPRQIVEFIPSHHGTSVIRHFYQLALQQQDTVNVEDYRYPGPRPRSREQAIMMLADSVEATVRSKAQNGKIISARDEQATGNGRGQNGMQTLEELVTSIIDERIRSGQLDECNLMIQDIARIRQAFISTLQGIYHPRVDYTPQIVKPS